VRHEKATKPTEPTVVSRGHRGESGTTCRALTGGWMPVVRRCRVMGKLTEGKRERRVVRVQVRHREGAAGVAGSGAKATTTNLPNMASLSFRAATRCTFMATYRPVSRSRTSMTRPYVPCPSGRISS
jgi:hypothetical protein